MIYSFIIALGVLLFSSTLVASEHIIKPEKELVLATILTSLPAHCAPTKEMGKVFTEEQLVFTGLVDQANVFKIFINKNGAWSSMLQNVAGITCVYFSGVPGMLKVPKAKENGT